MKSAFIVSCEGHYKQVLPHQLIVWNAEDRDEYKIVDLFSMVTESADSNVHRECISTVIPALLA